MKLLKLDLCFRLPDDFDGDLNSAIAELLVYRLSPKNHDKVYEPHDGSVYENWWDMVNSTDRVLFGSVSTTQLDTETNEWIPIVPKNV